VRLRTDEVIETAAPAEPAQPLSGAGKRRLGLRA
jgi:hypothetical protein